MNVRVIGVAVALVLAAACRTSGSQSRGDTAQAPSTGAQPPQTASDAQGGAAQGGQDPLVVPGPEIKAHASDQVVSGHVGEVSAQSVTIESELGDTKVLELAPETSITVDGQEATHSDIREGEPVRASFNEVDGREVAVALEVGEGSSLEELGSPPASEPGSGPSVLEPGSPSGASGGSTSGSGTGSSSDLPGAGSTQRQ